MTGLAPQPPPSLQITSLFQHLTPGLVAWLLRWRPQLAVPGWAGLSEEHRASMQQAGFVTLTLAPMGVWLLWAVTYYVLVSTPKVWSRSRAFEFHKVWFFPCKNHSRGSKHEKAAWR